MILPVFIRIPSAYLFIPLSPEYGGNLVSFWALCDCRIRQYYMPSINTAAFVAYTCEGLIPIPFIWYMYGVYFFVCGVALICPFLHFARIASFSDTYYLRLISIVVTIIYIVVTAAIDITKKRTENLIRKISKPIEYKKMEMIVKDLLPPEKII